MRTNSCHYCVLHVLFLACMLLLCSLLRSRVSLGTAPDDSPARDAAWAVGKAYEIVGVGGDRPPSGEPQRVSLAGDRTPFLGSQIAKQHAWRVPIKGPIGVLSAKITLLHVYLDAETGKTIRIVSEWPEAEPPLAPEPDSATATEQLRRSGDEVYHGFPDTEPKVTLTRALRAVEASGGPASSAKQVDCQYVMWSRMGPWRQPRAVWAITLRGIPPVHPPPGAPDDPVFSFRYIVDASTGDWLCGSNTPRSE